MSLFVIVSIFKASQYLRKIAFYNYKKTNYANISNIDFSNIDNFQF